MTTPITIAHWLCEATETILWQNCLATINKHQPEASLQCRVGSGQATYHKTMRQSTHHTITYGCKMVENKLNPQQIYHWRSAQEILRYPFFNHEISLLTVFSHTVCHEFAHLLQSITGGRSYNSVHNQYFYAQLHQLYADTSYPQQVFDFLQQKGVSHHIIPPPTVETPAPPSFKRGDLVYFTHKQQGIICGEVIRINRKTISVKPLDASLDDNHWLVSPYLLNLITEPAA